jgi:hypothetical protein
VENHPFNFLVIFTIICLITNQALKKIYFIKIDPLIFVTLHVSLVVSAVLYEAGFIEPIIVFTVLLMHISFLAGLKFSHSLLPYNYLSKITRQKVTLDNLSAKHAMLLFCFFYILYAVVIWVNFGLLILSDNPEYYRLQFTRDGLGFIYRISTSVIPPLFFLVTFAWKECSWVCRIIPIIALMLAIASSGKSILLSLIVTGLITSVYKSEVQGERTYQSYTRLIIVTSLALSFAIFVLYLVYGDAVNDEGQLIFLSLFLERISTAPGLGLTTYLQNMTYFDGILNGDFFSYLWNYLVVPIAAPLRLTEYTPTLARELGLYITGAEDYGPNPTLYGEGLAYFGSLFGWIYAFGIGCLISILRYLALRLAILSTPIVGALAFAYIYTALLALSTDFLVFMGLITTFTFVIILLYFLAILRKVVTRYAFDSPGRSALINIRKNYSGK